MTSTDIFKRRTGANDDDAGYYVQVAEQRAREYLATDSFEGYAAQIADIAVLYYQQDMATRQAMDTIGMKSVSYSEGGVSESVTALSGASISAEYSKAIAEALARLDRSAGKVVFL